MTLFSQKNTPTNTLLFWMSLFGNKYRKGKVGHVTQWLVLRKRSESRNEKNREEKKQKRGDRERRRKQEKKAKAQMFKNEVKSELNESK